MLYGLYTSGNGMRMQMRRQEVISNNLANSNTTGFKRNLFNIQEMGAERPRAGQTNNGNYDQFGGPQILSTSVSYEQGALVGTDNSLDFAIQGEGFFKLKNPLNGEAFYTRNGNFSKNKEGQLINADNGFLVMDQRDVAVQVNDVEGALADSLKVVTFSDLDALQKQEGTMFKLNPMANGQLPIEMPVTATVMSGYLEESNSNSINEMVSMIEAHRVYQANASNLKQQDENLGSLISIARS